MLSSGIARGGTLFSYNMVVTGQLTISSTDIQGTTFVNNLQSNGQPVFATSSSDGTGDTLTVAGAVTTGGSGDGLTVDNGIFTHHGALPSPFTLNLNGVKPDVTDSTLSITSLANQMTSAASYYDTLTATSISPSGNSLTLSPAGTGLDVYTITAAALGSTNLDVTINLANATQAVLIKVTGSSFTFDSSEHINVNGPAGDTTPDAQVLWYFPNATAVTDNDSIWNGALLAPNATLVDNNQDIMGGVYVANFTETAEIHLPTPSTLFTPPIPEPASATLLAAATVFAGLRRPRRIK